VHPEKNIMEKSNAAVKNLQKILFVKSKKFQISPDL